MNSGKWIFLKLGEGYRLNEGQVTYGTYVLRLFDMLMCCFSVTIPIHFF